MSTCAIVGITWGDEGKGRMVDLLSEDYDIVCRYQGGNNAGHTVVNELGEFKLNLLPSGICRRDVINVLGNGTVIDLEHLFNEVKKLRDRGVVISSENFRISDRAIVCMPYHREQDVYEEERLAGKKYGSTRRGIAPVYGDKYMKKAVQIGELLHEDYLRNHLNDILNFKNLFISRVYGGKQYTAEEIMEWIKTYGYPFRDCICDTGKLLRDAQNGGKKIMFEAQLGALRDIDYGIYPYTSSSTPLAAYAPVGCGAPSLKVDEVIGVAKAYSTCVGEGPFVTEWFDERADALREAGGEYGAATGRPRRVGPLDLVATRQGVLLQGATCVGLTKLDVVSYMDQIDICTAYEVDGNIIHEFPTTPELIKAKPVYVQMKGWKCDISKITNYEDLPKEARDYVEFIEKQIGCPIKYVSVGPNRHEIIYREV
ncbi:MAG: adenylosuccinate synthase [Clostridiales bacterium]|nr:adenylosuccinate synthase [Clostridiales bacterium]